MTVLDEIGNTNKYHHLVFIEFLDMLSRITITAITLADTIEYQAYLMLQIIYEKFKKLVQFPLRAPED